MQLPKLGIFRWVSFNSHKCPRKLHSWDSSDFHFDTSRHNKAHKRMASNWKDKGLIAVVQAQYNLHFTTYQKTQRRRAQIWVLWKKAWPISNNYRGIVKPPTHLVFGSYSIRVTTVAWHEGHVIIVGSGPTWGGIITGGLRKIFTGLHIRCKLK